MQAHDATPGQRRTWFGTTCRPAFGRGRQRVRTPASRRVSLDWFALEDRQLLSNVMVLDVTSPADSGPGTLRAAVAAANTSTRPVQIDFQLTGGSEITLTSGQLELSNTSEPIVIDGPGAGLTISGNNASRVFLIDPNVTASIAGVTISGGNAPPGADGIARGGGVYNQGALALEDVTVSDNTAPFVLSFTDPFEVPEGGGVYNQGALTLEDVTVSDNTALFGLGAGVCNASSATATLNNCAITGNIGGAEDDAGGSGAGLFNDGTMSLTGCTVSGNLNDGSGSGLENNGTATLNDCSVSGNLGSGSAIGINFGATTFGATTLTDCTVDGNSTEGIHQKVGPSTVTLTDCAVEDNADTGVVLLDANATITGCTISGNSGGYDGGGLSVGGTATITGCTISGNSGYYGGGLDLGGTATVSDCTITGNTNTGTSFGQNIGGGVLVGYGASTTITGCTISGNSAPNGSGGGVGIDGMATLTNCTISGNSAVSGGGVYNYGTVGLIACTISGNFSPNGGGINNNSSPSYTSRTTLTDTIVAGNTTGPGGTGTASDIGGNDPGDVTGSYNLTGTGGSGGLTTAGHNVLGVANPGLATLGDYGGPTETMALLPGSRAIHQGVAVPGVTTDQRGFPLDSPPDIGAFQTQRGPLVVDTAIDGLGSPPGELSLRQAVNLADVLTGGATITFNPSVFKKPSVITLDGRPLVLSNPTGAVTILGPGFNKLTVSGGGQSQDFEVNQGASALISGLTITGGFSTGAGGGVINVGTLTLAHVEVEDNSAAYGGGIFNAGTLTVIDSDVSNNVASTEGGGLYNKGAPVMLIGTFIKHNKPDNIFGPVIQSLGV
jgi:hypothetical protein